MGLYNALFGENPNKDKLLAILDIDQPNGKWSSGRFRDIYVISKGGQKLIALHNRNGGGNRENCWDEANPEAPDCKCAACVINKHLPQHPNYLYDEDDDFDHTYNTCYFTIPKIIDINNQASLIINDPPTQTPHEKWDSLIKKLDAEKIDKDDPDIKQAMKVGEYIFGKIKDFKDK